MNKVIELPNREQVYDQASLWIARLDRQLTSAEEQELRSWLAAHSYHRQVFLEMAELWDKMDSLARLADLFQAPHPAPQPALRQPQRRLASFAVAACLALAAFALVINSGALQQWLPGQQQVLMEAVYETALGEQHQVQLPDGSQLTLNTNSRARVTYTAGTRLFHLERGELNIQVAKDPQRPLSVVAGNKIVQAIGTAFNVRIHNEREVELLVTHGKVRVAQADSAKAAQAPERLPDTALALTQGEKILLGSAKPQVAKVDPVAMEAELSWRQGNLVFRGETLEQALQEISRYTSIQFDIQDDKLKQKRIAGLFKAGDVDGLLTALDQNFQIHYQRLDNQRVRLSAR